MSSVKELNSEEHQAVIEEMAAFDGNAFEPQVGIFWFNTEELELFDVKSLPVSSLPKNLTTINVLQKDVWAKNYFRAKARGKTESVYYGDYTQIPRGRIFYDEDTKSFSVKVGHWIEQYNEILTQLIKEEFNLPEFVFDIDEHWDLGHGWSEHDFLLTAKK